MAVLQNKKDRERIVDFIKSNHKKIHYFKNVHAKVIITGEKVFLGSANLTKTGVTEKIEMSVLISDDHKVYELTQWFNDMWDESDTVDIDKLVQYLRQNQDLPELSICKPKGSLPARSPMNKSKLASSQNEEYNALEIIKNHMIDHEELVKCLKKYPNKDWINSYFDLIKEIIDFAGLRNEDERLVMSILKSSKLPITINQRYVLRCTPIGKVGLIMPLEYNSESNFVKDGVSEEDKKYFFRNKTQEARWVNFNRLDGIVFSPEIKKLWKQAILVELNRGTRSGHRRAHKTVFYEAVNNLEYRWYNN